MGITWSIKDHMLWEHSRVTWSAISNQSRSSFLSCEGIFWHSFGFVLGRGTDSLEKFDLCRNTDRLSNTLGFRSNFFFPVRACIFSSWAASKLIFLVLQFYPAKRVKHCHMVWRLKFVNWKACSRYQMAAGLFEKRRQTIEKRQALTPGKEHDDLVRFALSGLSCMCAATGTLSLF